MLDINFVRLSENVHDLTSSMYRIKSKRRKKNGIYL